MAEWNPPQEVRNAAAAGEGRYYNPPKAKDIDQRYRTATRTQLPIGIGVRAIRTHVASRWRIATTYTTGRSRIMGDESRLDAHQAGIAVDWMGTRLDDAANWLVTNWRATGLMFLIWNRTQFSFSSRGRIGRYTGSHSHNDHIHAEFNPQGAAGTLPFYDTIPRPAPATPTSSASSRARRGTPNHPALTIDDGPAAPYLDHEAEASWLIPAGIGAGVIVAGVAAVAIYRRLERN